MTFPSIIRAVISILRLLWLGGDGLSERFAENLGVAIDGDLLEARGRSRKDIHSRLRHPEHFRQQFGYRTIGLAALGDGADANLYNRAAVGERFNSIYIVASAPWRET